MSRRNHQQIQDSQEEAEEAQEQIEHSVPLADSEEEEGQDLLENQEKDYERIEKLDNYEDEGVNDEVYELNPEHRKAAEKELREKQLQKIHQNLEVEDYMEDSEEQQIRKNRLQYLSLYAQEVDGQLMEEQMIIDAQNQKCSLDGWVNIEAVRRYIYHSFHKFIMKYMQNGKLMYFQMLKQMVFQNKQTLNINYLHLRKANQLLANWFARNPIYFIPQINAALFTLACKFYPNYKQIGECFVRLHNLSVMDQIRNLSQKYLGELIRVKGLITARSQTFNQLFKVVYKCIKCGFLKGPFHIKRSNDIDLGPCSSCRSNGPYLLHKSKSIYRNFQMIQIQQSPDQVPPGRIPRSKQAILFGDTIDLVKPGDEVELVGILMHRYETILNMKHGFPVFKTYIEVNSIKLSQEINKFSQIDQREFLKSSKDPLFFKKFYNSLAPSIYGHKRVKISLTMALFGGVKKQKNLHKIRGDINILLVGDPGIAKSQFLKSLQKIAPRCIYTTGKGASAVGLTAYVRQDKQTNQWKLQAGALVLADQGICIIDEFDKMTEADRTSIHQAMEQQTISISKAGIVTTLNARCSVVAAANPESGRYNQSYSFADNVNLSDPILSRFDIINVIKDKINQQLDGRIAEFVIKQHMSNHPYLKIYSQKQMQQEEQTKAPYSADFLRQYIRYAQKNYKPIFTSKSSNIIHNFYTKLRQYALECGGIKICPRHLESMIRMCQAHAKMLLQTQTTQSDAKFAVSMMLQTFIQTQKHSVSERLKIKFKNQYQLL